MARKSTSQQQTLSGSPIGNFTNFSPKPIQSLRSPTTADTGFEIGQLWVDTSSDFIYALSSVSGGNAEWSLLSTGESSGEFPVTPFVVGLQATAGFQTIQSAIDAANSAGGGTVYIQDGTFTENLTLADGVNLRGNSIEAVIITGSHTPPTSGSVYIQNLTLTSATDIFTSAAAGSTALTVETCTLTVTNGYVYDLPNWTGDLLIDDCGSNGTNDGVVNNTGGSLVKITSATVGAGTGNTFTYAGGTLLLEAAVVQAPITLQTGSTTTIRVGTTLTQTLTTANDSILNMSNSTLTTGANAAISHGSSGAVSISTCSIDSSNAPAIAGAGAGTLTLTGVDFLSNSSLAATLTTSGGDTTTGRSFTPLQPSFFAFSTATQANVTGDGTDYTVIFDSELYDTGSNYNTGTGIFTAPLTGKYVFYYSVYFSGLSALFTGSSISLERTGSAASGFSGIQLNPGAVMLTTNAYLTSASAVIELVSGDDVLVNSRVSGSVLTIDLFGTTVLGAGRFGTSFSGHFLG